MCFCMPDRFFIIGRETGNNVQPVKSLGFTDSNGILKGDPRNSLVRIPEVDPGERAPPGIPRVKEGSSVGIFKGVPVFMYPDKTMKIGILFNSSLAVLFCDKINIDKYFMPSVEMS